MAFIFSKRLWAIGGTMGLGLVGSVVAQAPSYPDPTYSYSYPPAPPVPAAEIAPAATYSAEQLDQMVGPIALYPDPLLSEVLAAATYPQDVASAGAWVGVNASPTDDEINGQTWDASIKALVHYPQVLTMMAGQMDWTEALGTAFVNQPQDVMNSVQRLRAEAIAAKTLQTTAQQQVVNDGGTVEILPAQPEVIYVPQYDPGVVYTGGAYVGPWITFGPPCAVGLWLNLGWDWHAHQFHRDVHWERDWHHNDWVHAGVWEHDRNRPIPRPQHAFVPPRSIEHRGVEAGRAGSGVFRPEASRRAGEVAPKGPVRPVTGLPKAPERPVPPKVEPKPVAPVPPRPMPVQPRPRPIEPAVPVAPRPVERPVQGLPARPVNPAPAPRPPVSPPPPARSAPPSPVFHPSGGGGSERGHSSMKK